MGRLNGKIAIITGTAGGQGRAAALLFAREGAKIVGCDVGGGYYADVTDTAYDIESPTAVEFAEWARKDPDETVALVRKEGGEMVSLHPCDLTSQQDAERLVRLALDTYGRIDILYNNAAKGEFEWFADMSHEMFWKCMKNELDTVFLPAKAVWPHFVAQGSGVIVNTSSMSASKVFEVLPCIAHTTVKAAVQGFTKHLAYEGSLHGIRVNCVSPGLIASPSTGPLLGDADWTGEMLRKHMIKRVGTPEDIAYAALYLASDESAWTTAANLAVDGGATAF
jgi:NAD(P)-dependent dehydrogenase (short-subunit alcohol dehydrogenase family)